LFLLALSRGRFYPFLSLRHAARRKVAPALFFKERSMNWRELSTKVIDGHRLRHQEGLAILETPREELEELLAAASLLREHFFANRVWFCSIINAKSGNCPEDCKFCAQAAGHQTAAPVFPLKSTAEILQAAELAHSARATEFCIVTSGSGPRSGKEFARVCEATSSLRERGWMKRCCSLGALTREQAQQLKAAGLQRANHNLETARSHFPNICSTHSWQDRVNTIENLKAAGIEVCSGGVIGMGESPAQRVELALELRELEVDSLPLNFITPIPGTPFADRQAPAPKECLKLIALFRFANPQAELRVCGGRELNLGELQHEMFRAGASGAMIGDYLTTKGRPPQEDLAMLAELQLQIAKPTV
jgi:biotin synthase